MGRFVARSQKFTEPLCLISGDPPLILLWHDSLHSCESDRFVWSGCSGLINSQRSVNIKKVAQSFISLSFVFGGRGGVSGLIWPSVFRDIYCRLLDLLLCLCVIRLGLIHVLAPCECFSTGYDYGGLTWWAHEAHDCGCTVKTEHRSYTLFKLQCDGGNGVYCMSEHLRCC